MVENRDVDLYFFNLDTFRLSSGDWTFAGKLKNRLRNGKKPLYNNVL
jgi:hypothetical protein